MPIQPSFQPDEIYALLQQEYGLNATLKALPSERDQNFQVIASNGQNYVLKIANQHEKAAFLEAQNQLLDHLEKSGIAATKIVPTTQGEAAIQICAGSGEHYWARLVTFLEGQPLGQIRPHPPALGGEIGRYLGRFNRAAAQFDHPALHRNFDWDLAQGPAIVTEYSDLISDSTLRAQVRHLFEEYRQFSAPRLSELPKCCIHNDANDFNLIIAQNRPGEPYRRPAVGLIDFGDMVYSYRVAELAVALAYACLDKPDPLGFASQIVAGFHRENPLQPAEFAALYGLMSLRICLSVVMAARQTAANPKNEYLSISQQAIRRTLPALTQIQPRFAEATFRTACGISASESAANLKTWLKNHQDDFGPVMAEPFSAQNSTGIDLSVGSPLYPNQPNSLSEPVLTARIFDHIQTGAAQYGVGGYLEARYAYTCPAFSTGASILDEHRTIHLGIDIFARPGTPVFAPLDGEIYRFANHASPYDYGPVLILAHAPHNGPRFYTLYGHLSEESLAGLTPGQKFQRGQPLGAIGSAQVNGNWTPHLHFQIISDLLEQGTQFPGVCTASQQKTWQAICPDPNLILRIPDGILPAAPLNPAQTLHNRRKRIGPSLSLGYDQPLKILRGWMQYLFDQNGRRYLDAYNNVPHVGHCHPKIAAAGRAQIGVLNTNTRYLHDTIHQYAEKITATLPAALEVCFFVNSGSEANELALRLARAYTGQKNMIVLEAAYHGNTTSLIDISPYKHDGPGGRGAPDWVYRVPLPDAYRGPYKASDPQAGAQYARHLQLAIDEMNTKSQNIAGFIAETFPSVGGQILPPDDYFKFAYQSVRAAGGICIADEVQTGYGRVGTHFYAFERYGVVPDIVVLGKPIGNGHPIGVVITRREIAAAFNNGMEFFSTFGGNPVSCATGLAVLEVVQAENLQAHALRVGNHLLEGLRRLKNQFEIIGDVRGSGLFLGVELVRDRVSLQPAATEAEFIANQMRQMGILLGTDGPHHNVIKIRPPMPFSMQDADLLLTAITQILSGAF